MASPNAALSTPRDDLGLYFDAIDLEAVRRGYIGLQIAPIIEAQWKYGKYSYRAIKDILKPTDANRTSEGRFNRIRSKFDKKTYSVQTRGLEEPVDHDEHAENLGMIDSELVASEATRHGCLEDHELRVIEKINAKAVSDTLAAGQQWTNDAADVVKYFVTIKRVFRQQCGFQPNAMLIDQTAVDALAANPSVLEQAGKVGSNVRDMLEMNDVTKAQRLKALALALGLSEIVESSGVQNVAPEPLAADIQPTFPEDKAVLFIKDMSNSTRNPQWLRTVHWSANGSQPGCAFDQYEEPQTDSTVIRHRFDTEIIEVNEECVMVLDEVIDLTALVLG